MHPSRPHQGPLFARNFTVTLTLLLTLILIGACSTKAFADCTVPSTPNDGYFDQSWGAHGCVVFVGDNRDASTQSQVIEIAVTSGSNILLGGNTSTHSGSWWVGELTDAGQFDAAFGDTDGSGRITECQLFLPATCPSEPYGFYDFLAQPDGKILALSNGYLSRTTSDGHALDTGVAGGTGHVSTTVTITTASDTLSGNDFGALAYAADGSLSMVGDGSQSMVAPYFPIEGIARFNADLSLDTAFHAVTDAGVTYAGGNFFATGDVSQAHQALLQSSGKTIVFGSKYNQDIRVTRLNVDGSVDTTFGSNGTTILSTPPAPCTSSYYPNVWYRNGAIDGGDRILVTGLCFQNPGYYLTVVARLSADGALDTAGFGSGGYYVNAPFAACPNQQVPPRAVVVDSAGRILVVGNCDSEFAVQRLLGNGTLDTSFGVAGLAHGRFDPASTGDYADAIVLDHGGRPLIGGYAQISTPHAAVARLTYDLIYTNSFESLPRGCLPPNCN